MEIHSEIAEHPNVQTDVYNDIEWDKYKAGLEATPCTNQILNQNMTRQDSG